MRLSITLVLFVAIVFTANGQSVADFRKMFDYDKSQELDVRIVRTIDTTQATIYDVLYYSTSGMRVPAYLVIPKLTLKAFPAIIFLPGTSQNKSEFLPEALNLAGEAIASLLIDPPSERPDAYRFTYQNYSEPKKDFRAYRQTVMDIRRAIDLLEQHERIIRDRIAFIGYEKGAMTGAVLSGVEIRVTNYILMDCLPSYSCELSNTLVKAKCALSSDQINQYELVMKNLNPAIYLASHRNNLIFFQFSQDDPSLTDETIKQLFQVTSEPKVEKFYKSGGLLQSNDALLERKNWLKNHL